VAHWAVSKVAAHSMSARWSAPVSGRNSTSRWQVPSTHMPSARAISTDPVMACDRSSRSGRFRERRLGRFDHADVALPSLVLELHVRVGDSVGVGVKGGERLVLGPPAAEQFVGDPFLPPLVIELDADVLAKILQRALRAEARPEIP